MIPEKNKYDVAKSKQDLIEKEGQLELYRQLLSEVIVHARQLLLMQQERPSVKSAAPLLKNLVERTAASVATCEEYIKACEHQIATNAERIRHYDILLNNGSSSTAKLA
jgi:hypothetical protein